VSVLAGSMTITDSVVRDVAASPVPDFGGSAIFPQGDVSGTPSLATIRNTFVARSAGSALWASGSNADVEGLVVIEPTADLVRAGWCVVASPGLLAGSATLTMRQAVLDGCRQSGVMVVGASATIEASIVRNVSADASGLGAAIMAQPSDLTGTGSALIVGDSVVQNVAELGVFAAGSDLELRHVSLAGAADTTVHVQHDTQSNLPATLLMQHSRVRDAVGWGVVISAAGATLFDIHIANTKATNDGLFGNGVGVVSEVMLGQLQLDQSLVEDSVLAGVASFGGGLVLSNTELRSKGIALVAEPNFEFLPQLDNAGGNVCGCGEPLLCKSKSAGLLPPTPPDLATGD
jgi:hypothetical protein